MPLFLTKSLLKLHAQTQTTVELANPIGSGLASTSSVPLLHRLLHMKSKAEPDQVVDRESIVKEPLLPCTEIIPEESESCASTEQMDEAADEATVQEVRSSPTTSVDADNGSSKKPWAMLKDASIKTGLRESSTRVAQEEKVAQKRRATTSKGKKSQGLVHIRQQTKMYASVDDLSPEYCGLPFVKKLKILNERQKLAELERVVRSSSLDCGESVEFDSNLTRSHSEACAIEYARKLAKLNKVRFTSLDLSVYLLLFCLLGRYLFYTKFVHVIRISYFVQ